MIRFTYDHDNTGTYIVYQVPSDVTASELVNHFSLFMLAMGYQPDNIKALFPED